MAAFEASGALTGGEANSPAPTTVTASLYEEGWEQQGKHIFVLSESGKPIFSRYGDEQDQASTVGLISALIAVVRGQGDSLRCIKAGQRRIVCFVRQGLYFISVSNAGEPEAVLAKQLDFMYNQVLLILTNRVHRILEEDSSKDLRDLLGADTTRLMRAACGPAEVTPPCIAFDAVQGVAMSATLRADILSRLRSCVSSSGAALGILLHNDALVAYHSNEETELNLRTADVLLLAHFVGNSKSLRSAHQNWVPLCLPHFNASAILQAYICNIHLTTPSSGEATSTDSPKAQAQGRGEGARSVDVSLILVSARADPGLFKGLHEGRLKLEEELQQEMLAARLLASLDTQSRKLSKFMGNTPCLHCFYKVSPGPSSPDSERMVPAQCLASGSEFPLDSQEAQDMVWTQYQRLALCLRAGASSAEVTLLSGGWGKRANNSASGEGEESAGDAAKEETNIMSDSPASDHALAYVRLNNGFVVVGLATSDTEIYATFPDAGGSLEACGTANYFHRQLKIDTVAGNMFQMIQ